jgi:hypothetical protein
MFWDRNEKGKDDSGECQRRTGKIIKDGRHVGLDFYDLLIEALMVGAAPCVFA